MPYSKRIPVLDLHRVLYHEVENEISNFIMENQFKCPIMIDCGHAKGKTAGNMVEIAFKTLEKLGCKKYKEGVKIDSKGRRFVQTGWITIFETYGSEEEVYDDYLS